MRGRTSTTRGFRQEKWFEINRILTTHRIAILAIQELHLSNELAESVKTSFETKLALYHSPLPDTNNAAGVAIVVNKSLVHTEGISYDTIIPGRAILVKIPRQTNTTIKILNVYAPNDTKNNENFWEQINEITANRPELRPDVLLGDFNLVEDCLDRLPCHPDDPNAVAALGELKSNLNLVDGWRRTHPDKREYTHQHAPNASQGRIDRIYVSNNLLRTTTDWGIAPPSIETDHWLVSTRISTPDDPEIGRGRWQIPSYLLDKEEIISDINEIAKKAQNNIEANRYRRTATNNPQTILAKLKEDIVAICRSHAKKIHPTITNKIEKLKKQLAQVHNNDQTTEEDKMLESLVIKTEILELEHTLFESNRVYAKTKHHVHAETICRDWTRTNRARKPRDTIFSLYNPISTDQQPIFESRSMAETAKTYHKQLQSIDRDPTDPPDATKLSEILNNISTRTTPDQKNELVKYLSRDKTYSAVNASANDKAAGIDGIPMELWKKMSALFDINSEAIDNPYCDIVSVLTKVFNDIEEHGIDPLTRFNEGWMCPLYKKGERNNIANYRPITVLNTDYKIMTKAIANKLAEVAPHLIHSDQAGFIKGRSIFDQVNTGGRPPLIR